MPDDEVTIKIAADVSTASAGIELLVDGMGDLIKGLTDVIKSSEDIGKSVKDLGESFEGFSKQVEANTKELIASREASIALAKDQAEAAKAKADADKVQADLDKKAIAAEKERLAIEKEREKAAQKATKEAQALAQAYGMQLSKAFDTVTTAIKDTVKAFPAMIAHVAEAGDQMLTMSNRIGVSVEDLSELKYMAGQSGANMEGLARTVQSLGGIFAETGEKGQKIRDSLKSIGLSVEDLKKQDPKSAFLDIVKAIQSTVPAADQGRVAMEIFGSKFRTNTMILKEDIGSLQAKFKELGGGMTTELAKAGDEYGDNLKNIQQVQENFRNQIVGAVLPAVNSLLETFPKLGGLALTVGENVLNLAQSMGPMIVQLYAARVAFMQNAAAAQAMAVAEGEAAVATGVLATAMEVLMGPVGWILAALALLGAAWFVFSNSQSEAEKATRGHEKAFRDQTNALDDAIKTYDELHGKLSLTEDQTKKLEGATRLLAEASGVSEAAFKADGGAAAELVKIQKELLKGRKDLQEEAIKRRADEKAAIDAEIEAAKAKRTAATMGTMRSQNAPQYGGGGMTAVPMAPMADAKERNLIIEEQTKKIIELEKKSKEAALAIAILGNSEEKVVPPVTAATNALQDHINAIRTARTEIVEKNKAQIAAALAQGLSADAIAKDFHLAEEETKNLSAAISQFKKEMEDAKRAADQSAFAKLSKEAKELAAGMTEAYKAGQSNRQVWDTFAKSAEKVWQEARKIPGALESLPAIVSEVALSSSWDQLEKSIAKVFDASQRSAQKLMEGAGVKLEPSKMLAPAIAEDGTIRWVSQDTYKELGEMQKAAMQRFIEETMVGGAKITALRELEWQKQLKAYRDARKNEDEIALLHAAFEKETQQQILKGDTETIEGRKRLAKSLLDQYEQMSKTQNLNDETRIAMLQKIVAAETAAGIVASKSAKELIALNLKVAESTLKRVEAAVLAGTADVRAYEAAKKNLEALQLANEHDADVRRKMEAEFEQARLKRMQGSNEWAANEIANQKAVAEAAERASHRTIGTMVGMLGSIGQLAAAFSQLGLASDSCFDAIAQGAGIAASALDAFAAKGTKDFGVISGMQESLSGTDKDWTKFAGNVAVGAQAVVQGYSDIKKATDTLSTKKNVLGGAAAGAKAGAAFGPWGIVIGAGVGAITGALRNKGAIRAAKQAATDFGAEIPIEMAKAIDKEAKARFGGDRLGAELLHMGDMIKAAGGITDQNVKQMQARVMDSFNLMHAGKLTATETTKVLEESFGSFADHMLKSGKVADKGFVDMITGAKTMGVQTKEMADFVVSQVARLGTAFEKMVRPIAKASGDIAKAIADQKKQVEDAQKSAEGKPGDEEAQKRLMEQTKLYQDLIDKQKVMAEDSLPAINRAGRLMMATFNAAREAGTSMTDAVEAMGPGLDSLIQSTKDLGIEVADTSVGWLASFRDRVVANRDLVDSAASLNEIMLAMSNIGALNADTFKDLEDQGSETYDALIAKGFEQNEALMQMKPFLEQVRNAHTELKLPIDDNTKALIDQAEKAGILGKEQKSTNDVLMEGFSAIIEAVGGKLPDAFKKYRDAAVLASQQAAGGMKNVEGASDHVQGSLAETDWSGWSADAVSAANEAQAAIDAVSLGSSPGGIKEIPIQLAKAMKSFKEFEKIGTASANEVKDAVDSMKTTNMMPDPGETTDAVKQVQEVVRSMQGSGNIETVGFAAHMSEGTQQDAQTQRTAQIWAKEMAEHAAQQQANVPKEEPLAQNLTFHVSTINADGLKQAVEKDIMPKLLDALDRNNRGSQTKLRQIIG